MHKRVLLITNMYPSKQDQTHGRFVERCALALRSGGIEVDVVGLTKCTRLLIKIFKYAAFAVAANSRILLRRYDRIYVHYPLHSLLACIPALLIRRSVLALNFHGHDLVPLKRRGLWIQKILAGRICKAQIIVVPSKHFKALFDAQFGPRGAQPARVFYSGGVNDEYFLARPRPALQRNRSALFLSRFVAEKGWKTFLNIAIRLKKIYADFTFTAAGVGPDRELIISTAKEMGLLSCMQILDAHTVDVNRELFLSHRYFIFPSQYDESLALVNLEAMACGCIVISADFNATSEYLNHGANGLCLSLNGFVDACVNEIVKLENEPESAQLLSGAAMDLAANFRESAIMQQLPAILGL